MKSIKKKLYFSFIASVLFMALVSCGSQEGSIEIVYNLNNGSSAIVKSLDDSANIILPDDPLKTGYEFDGWYFDDEVFSLPFTKNSNLINIDNKKLHVFAKWKLIEYTMSFVTNCDLTIAPVKYSYGNLISSAPTTPTRDGFTFKGWYSDTGFNNLYPFNTTIDRDITLYAQWEVIEDQGSNLTTNTLPIYSGTYGNTNGNLNNLGLAVYDSKRMVHYLSNSSDVLAFDPATNITTLLFSLETGGRPTYLNVNKDKLYYIDNYNGHLFSYDLINKTFLTLSEEKNIYASHYQSWLNFIFIENKYDQEVFAYQRYDTNKETFFYVQGYGFEHINLFYTRVYYKPVNELHLSVVNYNGVGKNRIVDLEAFNITKQHETLLYDVDNDYVSYFALILSEGENMGVYLYNSNDGLVKVLDGDAHNLNYDGNNIYVILNNQLYKIDPLTQSVESIYLLLPSDAYLNIINHWIYIGSYSSNTLYKINPVTQEKEPLLVN